MTTATGWGEERGGGEKTVVNAVIGKSTSDSSLLERADDEDDDVSNAAASPCAQRHLVSRDARRLSLPDFRGFYLVTLTAPPVGGIEEWD